MKNNDIHDIYITLLNGLKKKVMETFAASPTKLNIIEKYLDRKLVKTLFMPLLYGKTLITMIKDVREVFIPILDVKDCTRLAEASIQFFTESYPHIINYMKLINNIGWLCAMLKKEVKYDIPFFTTVQDYRKSIQTEVNVYAPIRDKKNEDIKIKRRKHRITLRSSTDVKDRRKTHISTCVNYIHQKDAYIAMRVVEGILNRDPKHEYVVLNKTKYRGKIVKSMQSYEYDAYTYKWLKKENPRISTFIGSSIYTVHDNFIAPLAITNDIAIRYIEVIASLGAPIRHINQFFQINLGETTLIEREAYSNDNKNSKLEYFQDPITSKVLRTTLDNALAKMGAGLNKREKESFKKKIEDVIKGYERYIFDITGYITRFKYSDNKHYDVNSRPYYVKDGFDETEITEDMVKDLKDLQDVKWGRYKNMVKLWLNYSRQYPIHY